LGWLGRANKKLLFAIVIVVAAVGILMGTSLKGALSYYVTVDELKAKGGAEYGDRVRVGGKVVTGTIVKDSANNLSFAIYHSDVANTLPVRYKGIVPDIFGDDKDVIVEGRWNTDGSFYATNLISQHPPEFVVSEANATPHPMINR